LLKNRITLITYKKEDIVLDGDRVVFDGYIEQIRQHDPHYGHPRILLTKCSIEKDRQLRTHMWIKVSKGALNRIKRGIFISGEATVTYYMNPETCKKDKLGLTKVRKIKQGK